MRFYTTSKRLIFNVRNFYRVKFYTHFCNNDIQSVFLGWGRRKSGLNAMRLAKKHKAKFMLLEDGFIRSLNLGVENSPSFSLVIYN